jgi:hypothetical protein
VGYCGDVGCNSWDDNEAECLVKLDNLFQVDSMNIIDWLFRRNWIYCPRCIGKGHVDLHDIERLSMQRYWRPGKCAYCKGKGKVPPDRPGKISPDLAYLSLDVPSWERYKLINGDPLALQRARKHKALIDQLVQDIQHLYYIENREPDDIAAHLFQENGNNHYTQSEKQELIDYINKVLKEKM